jgi:hypothetical protein
MCHGRRREFFGCATVLHHFNHLTTELRPVGWACSGYRELPEHTQALPWAESPHCQLQSKSKCIGFLRWDFIEGPWSVAITQCRDRSEYTNPVPLLWSALYCPVSIGEDMIGYVPVWGETFGTLRTRQTITLPPPPRPCDLVYADPPWPFRTYSEKGQGRSPEHPLMLARHKVALIMPLTFLESRRRDKLFR